MFLDHLSLWAGIISDITSAIAFIIGGIWFCWKFIYMRTGAWNLKMVITPEAFCYNDNQYFLNINVSLSNGGNTKITPGSRGCIITVRRMNKNITEEHVLDLDKGETIIENYDILQKYKRPGIGYKNYEIEPNSEYHELACVKVSPGDILSIRTEFFWKDEEDSITEYKVFHVDQQI